MRLPNNRYEEIKIIICEFLSDYDVNTLPIDVFELARKMNIKIIRASEILIKHPKMVMNILFIHFHNCFCIMIRKINNLLYI